MIKYFCDRCEAEMPVNEMRRVAIHNMAQGSGDRCISTDDICHDCFIKLEEWRKNE